jgi:hypothetical protein
LSNTIGNVPAVVMILQVWRDVPEGTLVGLAILSTFSGNLFLASSLANLIEHAFGTLKLWMGQAHFLMKRLLRKEFCAPVGLRPQENNNTHISQSEIDA